MSATQTLNFNNRVAITIVNKIATVTLNRADKRNALDMPMFCAIRDAIKYLKKDKNIRAVILQGDGEDFCSGLDTKSVLKSATNGIKLLFKWLPGNANLAQIVTHGWQQIPVPVIAAVHGRCWGGGLQIALGADFRMATPDSQWSIMEGKWGLIPDMGGTPIFRQLMRQDVAMKMAMSAEVVDGEKAQALGLVTELHDDPHQAALELAEQLSQRSPDAIAGVKKLYHKRWFSSVRSLLSGESLYQIKILMGKNQRIATKRSLTKEGETLKPFAERKNW